MRKNAKLSLSLKIVTIELLILSLIGIATVRIVAAADLCRAIALRDVPSIEAPSAILRRGEYLTAVTQYIVNKHTGETSFCAHGDYCYPTHIYIKGKKVEALRLVNCKVGGLYGGPDDEDETIYSIVMDRSKNTKSDLRWDDLDNRFEEMGLGSACAANVTEYYVKKPSSRCAKLAKQALEGNPDAVQKLLNCPDYCKWK